DPVEIDGRHPPCAQTEFYCPLREIVIVLLPAESFLLGRGHKLPVDDEGGGRIVEVARDTEDSHRQPATKARRVPSELAPRAIQRGLRRGWPEPPPLGRARLERQRVGREANDYGERGDDEQVGEAQHKAGLSIADGRSETR